MTRLRVLLSAIAFLVLFFSNVRADRHDYGFRLGMRQGERVTFGPTGTTILSGALDPVVRKWYVPQELIQEYRWGGWKYTNYAKSIYKRYVDRELEGDLFYDLYGDFVTEGWLIYDWRQEQPREFGSDLLKTGRFVGWFRNLVIATDAKGEYHYAITIGDQIKTTLTPMTFSKPSFNGIQWDFQSDRYSGTLLLSRINSPVVGASFWDMPSEITGVTNLMGGRGTIGLGDFITVGATYVNSHNSHTLQGLGGNPFKGSLYTNKNISFISIKLSDDSPEDGEGGAAFFWEKIFITDLKGNRIEGKDIAFDPIIEGGILERGAEFEGYLSANGGDTIVLTYDFTDPSYTGPKPSEIHHVSFKLALARDYKVEVTSNLQPSMIDYVVEGEPVFLLVTRAPGNPKSLINQRLVEFDYGLPTANEIYGFTVEVEDVNGFSLQGELDFSRRYRQYPNQDLKVHHTAVSGSNAWYLNLSYLRYPWQAFGEIFSMDYDYSTTSFIWIDYGNELESFYEFVDDNDDFDRFPDWPRRAQPNPGGRVSPGDNAVFPGLDENSDFISDFNQNDNPRRPNLFPDYEEPFLRYSVDRPEFLFGMDMNNNLWVDRFENDLVADYPYKKDHRGYNFYLGAYILPGARLTIGHLHERLISSRRHNLTTYGLFALERDYPGLGRLRIFQSLKKVRDNIQDDLFQWFQPANSRGYQAETRDYLPAQNTWVSTAFLGFDYSRIQDLNFVNKLKYEVYHQRDSVEKIRLRYPFVEARGRSGFFGLINKADYTYRLGDLMIQPRWKSEFRWEVPYLKADERRKEASETFFLSVRFPWLFKTVIQTGLELTFFQQFREPTPPGLNDDFFGMVWLTQLTNSKAFLGYRIITQVGFRLNRQDFEDEHIRTTGTTFVTVFAGIQE